MINLRKNDALADAVKEILQQEALKGDQHLIDKNKNNKVDAHDFKILRGEKKTVKEEENVDEEVKDEYARKVDKYLKKKYNKEEENVDEGIKDIAKKAFKALTGGSDEDQLKALQKRTGVPQTGKKPTQKEEVELDEGKEESKKDFDDRQKRLAAASAETAKDPKRLERLSKIPGYSAAMDLAKKTTKEEVQGKTLRQFKENAFDWKKKPEPQPNGGSGVKQGSRYGGSKQKDKPEQETDEKK
jgi:hypothetical protein